MLTYKQLSLFTSFLVLLSLVLAGCGGSNNTAGSSAQAASGAFKVALLLPGEADDKSWSQVGYEGLKLVEKELGAQVAYTANVSEAEAEKVARKYANEDYNFIIGHGGEYVAGFEVVAKEFPQIKFAIVGGYPGNNKNFGALGFRSDEIGYLPGVVAGLKTKTNKIAFIGGVDYPDPKMNAEAYVKGAKSVNPQVEVFIEWVGNWSDTDKAGEIAQAQIAAGVDVLTVNADAAGVGVIEAAKKAGVYAIGWAVDQNELAPKTVLTSGIQRTQVLYVEGATLVQQGRWEGKQYRFGFQEGVQELAPFHGLLTSEEEAQVKTVRENILTNKIDVSPQ